MGPSPTDRAKGGMKRSLLTESGGVPIGLAIDGANRHDCKLVRATLESIPVQRPEPTPENPQNVCQDKACDYAEVRALGAEFGYTVHIKARGQEAHGDQARGGVQGPPLGRRADAQLDEPLRADTDRWEKKAANCLALLHLVCGLITYRALGLSG